MDKNLARRIAQKIEVLLRNYNNTLAQTDFDALIGYLNKKCNLQELVEILADYPCLFHALNAECFEDYWYGQLVSIPIGTQIKDFSFKKPTYLSSLECIMGYVLYLILWRKDTVDYEPYFDLANQYHSFYAAQAGIYYLSSFLLENKQAQNELMESFEPASYSSSATVGWKPANFIHCSKIIAEVATNHGTPGYLLQAHLYFTFAVVATTKFETCGVPEQKAELGQRVDYFIMHTFKNLLIAELVQNKSATEIHNAYLGRSMAGVFHGFTSIAELKEYLLATFSESLSAKTATFLSDAASAEASNYLRRLDFAMRTKYNKDKEPMEFAPMVSLEAPLLKAARLGDLTEVSKLYAQDPHSLEDKDENGNTGLHLAVFAGKKDVVQFLLEKDTSLSKQTNKFGERPIDLAETPDLKMVFKDQLHCHSRNIFFKTCPTTGTSIEELHRKPGFN